MVMSRIARQANDTDTAKTADAMANETTEALVAWWKRTTNSTAVAARFKGSKELDPFIGSGDALSFRIAPHRHKIAMLHDLTPEVLRMAEQKTAGQPLLFWWLFSGKHSTWHLVGEERQVHYGENFIDPPDLAVDAFRFLTWIRPPGDAEFLTQQVDLPFCRADLNYITKLALALEPR